MPCIAQTWINFKGQTTYGRPTNSTVDTSDINCPGVCPRFRKAKYISWPFSFSLHLAEFGVLALRWVLSILTWCMECLPTARWGYRSRRITVSIYTLCNKAVRYRVANRSGAGAGASLQKNLNSGNKLKLMNLLGSPCLFALICCRMVSHGTCHPEPLSPCTCRARS